MKTMGPKILIVKLDRLLDADRCAVVEAATGENPRSGWCVTKDGIERSEKEWE